MRKLLLVAAFAVACGGGGGGGSGSGGLSGTVGGKAFAPIEVKAIPADTTAGPCTIPGTGSVGLKAIALQITSYAGACGDFTTTTCQGHMGAQNVTVLVAKVNPLGQVPALPPGTYALNASPTTVIADGSGMLNVGFAQALGNPEGSCTGVSSVPTSGTIRLDSVGDPVTGHVSVTFADGSKLDGDFSAPVCAGLHPDICQLASSGSICTGMSCM